MTPGSANQTDACGCCAGNAPATPMGIVNRPGLTAIAYRVGTYATFLQSLLARLSDGRWPALRQLRTRDQDDFSVALLDAWAVVGDILTFYQERIANESYLSTATERRSILEQARLLGYQLGPGVAASTHLAFTMEAAPGQPTQAAKPITLPVGTKVQSVPGPDELPQVFETSEEIEARVEWNALQPRRSKPQVLQIADGRLYLIEPDKTKTAIEHLFLSGTNTGLRKGDLLLMVGKNEQSEREALPLRIQEIETNHEASWTRVVFTVHTEGTPPTKRNATSVSKPGKPPVIVDPGLGKGGGVPLNEQTVRDLLLGKSWTEDELWALAWTYNWNLNQLLIILAKLSREIPRLDAGEGVFALRTKVGFFGHNAPYHKSLLDKDKLPLHENGWDGAEGWPIWKDQITDAYYVDADVYLEHAIPSLVGDSWAVFELSFRTGSLRMVFGIQRVSESTVIGFGLTGKATGLTLTGVDGVLITDSEKAELAQWTVRKSTAYVQDDRLELAPYPIEDPLQSGEMEITLDLWVSGLRVGQQVMLTGQRADAAGIEASELLALTGVTHAEGYTTIRFDAGLTYTYIRSTVRINANVAAATHGETVSELLGSGDATIPYQRFVLSQMPLTHVSANTATGSVSSLKVHVNDVLWEEVPFLFGHGPTDRIYVTQRDDEGRTTIRFGDGLTGARLPTGQNNVRAEYRKGTGLSGLVDAGQISQLLSRPLGLKDVANPAAPQGAEDPETRDGARKNAPLTVLTLDRAVSLQDYADFARTFAGIAKAQAVWVWDGRIRRVFLTVAGPDGQVLDEAGAVITSLKGALRAYGDPFVAFTIKPYRKALFQIHGTVMVDGDHVAERVLTAIHEDLRLRYAFEAREFGQPVALSQVVAAIQAVPGVVAVDIDKFYRTNVPVPALRPRLIADRPAMGADGLVAAAELLLLDEPSLTNLTVAL